jgi:hypothetical protein
MGAREDQDSSSMGASATTRSELLTVNENDWDGATPKREASFGVTLALEDHAAIVAVDTHYSNLYNSIQGSGSSNIHHNSNNAINATPSDAMSRQTKRAVHISDMFKVSDRERQLQVGGDANYCPYVPNSAHYDHAMPDWEGVTIAEHTMADISTVTPAVIDYNSQNMMAVMAHSTEGEHWDENNSKNTERDWRIPRHNSSGSGDDDDGSECVKRIPRKYLFGGVLLMAAILFSVAVVVPLTLLSNKESAEDTQFSGALENNSTVASEDKPLNVPTVLQEEVPVGDNATTSSTIVVNTNSAVNATTDAPTLRPSSSNTELNSFETTQEITGPLRTLSPTASGISTNIPLASPTFSSFPTLTELPLLSDSALQQNVASNPTSAPTPFVESCITIELQTDQFGTETSWDLTSFVTDPVTKANTTSLIVGVEPNTYDAFEKESVEVCLPRGTYRFTLRDSFGDGFSATDFKGYYAVFVDEREIIRGGYYRSEISYDILIGYEPAMTERDRKWLEAHNVRRKTWHESNGVSYVPLRWSTGLAKGATSWAEKLLSKTCSIVGIEHEPGVEAGENLAKNRGETIYGMGALYPPENIVRRWVDFEANVGFPQNAHLTQVLWR